MEKGNWQSSVGENLLGHSLARTRDLGRSFGGFALYVETKILSQDDRWPEWGIWASNVEPPSFTGNLTRT
jgi:hypothetical protein